MALSQTPVAGALPGLLLKAWASIKADGTLIKGGNIASVVRTAAGVYSITFTVAMASATYFVKTTVAQEQAQVTLLMVGGKTTAAFSMTNQVAGVGALDGAAFVEIYE